MSTIAVSMMKDEADIVEATVTRMAGQVDHMVIADNGSTDGTREILDQLAAEISLTVVDDPEPAYYQAAKMTALAEQARTMGADWVIPFDADEVWQSRFGPIKDVLAELSENVALAELYHHVATAADGPGDPVQALEWRRIEKAPLPKVACRTSDALKIDQGNHDCSYIGQHKTVAGGLLTVRHFPYRSVAQMVSKARNGAAAYAATDLPEHVGQHWRDYGRLSDLEIGDVFRKWYWSPSPELDDGLIFDPCP